MEVDWPGRPSTRLADYMVHRITTGHNDTRDFRLERKGGGVHVRGGRLFQGPKSPLDMYIYTYMYTPRISVCAQCAAIKSRVGTTSSSREC